MLKISAIKSLDRTSINTNVMLKAVVLRVSDTDTSINEKYKSKFYASLADETGTITATIYDINLKSKFIVDMGVVLMNALIKENYIAVTSRTEVAMAKPFTIEEEIKKSAANFPGEDVDMTVTKALQSPIKAIVNVRGKVVKVSPAAKRTVDGEERDYQELILKDSEDKITIAVWEDMVNKYCKGNILQLTKCRVRLFSDQKRLTTTRTSQCETLSEGQIQELDDVSDEDDKEDDFATAPQTKGIITGICDVDPYLACPLPGCNNKKLTTVKDGQKYLMECSTCRGRFVASSCKHYLRVSMFLETHDAPAPRKVTIFKPEINKILAANFLDAVIPESYDKNELSLHLLEMVGLEIRCNIINNAVKDLVVKRST